jgi:hypothetical protein
VRHLGAGSARGPRQHKGLHGGPVVGGEKTQVRVISDNYSCRSATTIPAGRRGPE